MPFGGGGNNVSASGGQRAGRGCATPGEPPRKDFRLEQNFVNDDFMTSFHKIKDGPSMM